MRACCVGLVVCMSVTAGIAAEPAVAWRTGNDFFQQWQHPIGITWSGNPLRPALTKLSRDQRIAMFLDRRVDPDQRVRFSATDMPLEDFCRRLASQLDAGIGRVGPVVYVGPPSTASKIATVAAVRRQEIQALPAAQRAKWLETKAWSWSELAEPRELIEKLVADVGWKPRDLERAIPHDLWPAVDLTALPCSDRLTLLLAGFDLTFKLSTDGTTLELIPLPETVRYEQTYAVRGSAPKAASELSNKFPQAEIQAINGRVAVAGSFEDHELIERTLRGEKIARSQVVAGPKTYTVKVDQQPLGALVRAVAEKLNLEVEFHPAATDALARRISFEVNEVPLDELLTTAFRDSGLTYQIRDKRLTVQPR